MAVKYAELDGLGKVALYKRRSNRHIRLSIAANGEIRVSLPSWAPYRTGIQFALSKKDWLLAQQTQNEVTLSDGQAIGKAHRLTFKPSESGKVTTKVTDLEIIIFYPKTVQINSSPVQSAAKRAAIKALGNEAKTFLPQQLATLAQNHGFSYKDVRFRQLKSRWGSCDTNTVITLNVFLMQLPWSLIDYVLLHELVHTKVFRHGPDFWKTLELYSPNAKTLRKQLSGYRATFSTKNH